MRRPALVFGPARHVVAAVAILRRLLEEHAVLDERPAQLEIGRPAGDAVDVVQILVALAAERRAEVVEPDVPRVAAAAGLNHHEARRESSVLDRVRIRHDRHRIDRIVGQREVDEAEHGIGERAGADLHAGLRRPSAFDADAAGHFDHAREQAQRAAEPGAVGELVGFVAARSTRTSRACRPPRRSPSAPSPHRLRQASRAEGRETAQSSSRRTTTAVTRPSANPSSDGGDGVFALLQRREAEAAVALRQHRRDFLIRRNRGARPARRRGGSCRSAS